MRSKRTLKKIEAMCSAEIDVYECDACMWMVNVASTKALHEVEMDFEVHNCDNNSLSKMLAATVDNAGLTIPPLTFRKLRSGGLALTRWLG